jgi:hypothetical protein
MRQRFWFLIMDIGTELTAWSHRLFLFALRRARDLDVQVTRGR